MRKFRLENIDIDLREKLKDEKFRQAYELECAKVALAYHFTPKEQKIVAKEERQYLKGKGINWRKVKRPL